MDKVYANEPSHIEVDINDAFLESLWSEDEKCALFFMLSHSVVPATITDNHIRVRREVHHSSKKNSTLKNKSKLFANRNLREIKNETIELGVVTYRNNREHAIAADRVLHGALAGYLNPPDLNLFEIVPDVDQEQFQQVKDAPLDSIMLVTLTDLLGAGAIKDDGSTGNTNQKFGGYGQWSSNSSNTMMTTCGERYLITRPSYAATLAQLRGGVDGYVLGTKIRDNNLLKNMKLSTVLRQYYSSRGFGKTITTNPKTGGIRFCDRNLLQNQFILENGKTLFGAYQVWEIAPDNDNSRWNAAQSGITQVWSEITKQLGIYNIYFDKRLEF